MGTMELLFVFVAHFIAAESAIATRDPRFPPPFPHHGLLNEIFHVPFERGFDFPSYDGVFGPWPASGPGLPTFAELPPLLRVPNVRVSCDGSRLTLLVDKSLGGVELSGEEVWLGDGCRSSGDLPGQLVFSYGVDRCGTTVGVRNGFQMFSNSLHFDVRRSPFTHLVTPSTMHVSCMAERNPITDTPKVPPESKRIFTLKAMNPSWTDEAASLTYKRGQVVNLQVSARLEPAQQLFLQSCFASASPHPQGKPRHALVLNKGCTVPSGSPHAAVRFAGAPSADVVNFALNTTYFISEIYIHCSVLVSDRLITPGSKSCNYNVVASRWEELGGNVEVCRCCSSRCKGLSVKQLPEDAKAIVSTGPLVIVDGEEPTKEPEGPSDVKSGQMQSDAAAPEDTIISGASVSKNDPRGSSPPLGVVVVGRDPASRLTLWLPGQVQLAKSESQVPERERPDEIEGQRSTEDGGDAPVFDLEIVTRVDGGSGPRRQRKEAEETWIYGPRLVVSEAARPTDVSVVTKQEPADEVKQTRREDANPPQPVVRSKLQVSKSTDGSQSLSYEEEVVTKGGSSVGTEGHRRGALRQWGLLSAFVDLLRRLVKAE